MRLEKSQTDEAETSMTVEDFGLTEDKENVRFHCPNCATPMVSMKENSVQCEILTPDSQSSSNKLLAVNSSRRSSVQSVTEIREDVTCDEGVSTAVESNQAPDEIILVTRSFENEAQPPPPRRSSIAQFFTNIKSLGTRYRSEPDIKKRFLEENDAAMPTGLRSGIRRNSTGLRPLSETNSEEDLNNDLGPRGPQLKRHSVVQMSNGQVVQEDIEECAGASAVTMDDDVAPGEINIVTRCFETPENYAPRRESIIDKLNFVKMIGKNRKRKDQPESSIDEDDEEPVARYAASGVRRKSIAPASLAGISEDNRPQEETSKRAGLAAPDHSDDQAVRYVTSGIRRGSVAMVSAAPPCRGADDEKEDIRNGPTLQPDGDAEVRYVTSGIRRGSVAAVSAAPPCRLPENESSGSLGAPLGTVIESPNQQRRGSYERIETYKMDPVDQDVLRSGVRRRSLAPAADGGFFSSPSTATAHTFNPLANETIYTSGEDESEDEVARKISNSSGENLNERKKKPKRQRKKGVMDLFESLTGREADVNYENVDAKAMEERKSEENKKTSFDSSRIPQIMLSIDDSKYDDGNEGMGNEKDHMDENDNEKREEISSSSATSEFIMMSTVKTIDDIRPLY